MRPESLPALLLLVPLLAARNGAAWSAESEPVSESRSTDQTEAPNLAGMARLDRSPPRWAEEKRRFPAGASLVTWPFWLGIRFFQKVISPIDGPRCPMHPTCSRYALEAIRRNGAAIGILMAADRLIRDNGDYRRYRRVVVHGQERFNDPVEDHEFWSPKLQAPVTSR